MGLEVLVVTPLLATLVLFVVWAGNSGRSNLAASLAVEEAAVAAAVVCVGDDGIDSDCVQSAAEQVVANRVPAGIACTPPPPPPESGESTAEPGRSAVVVSFDCGTPAGGEQFTSSIPDTTRRHTGVHVLLDEIDIPAYTGDRPTSPTFCGLRWRNQNSELVWEPYPEPSPEPRPGNATPALIKQVSLVPLVANPTRNYITTCFHFQMHEQRYPQFSHDIIFKLWTQDNRHTHLKSATGGDTCHNYENTGVDYLQIPKQFPQYTRLVPSEFLRTRERLSFPAGICSGEKYLKLSNYELPGVYELHIEIVSGGSGHIYLLCGAWTCRPP